LAAPISNRSFPSIKGRTKRSIFNRPPLLSHLDNQAAFKLSLLVLEAISPVINTPTSMLKPTSACMSYLGFIVGDDLFKK
jgi:hypothetical protein